jgi:hypothetical protein
MCQSGASPDEPFCGACGYVDAGDRAPCLRRPHDGAPGKRMSGRSRSLAGRAMNDSGRAGCRCCMPGRWRHQRGGRQLSRVSAPRRCAGSRSSFRPRSAGAGTTGSAAVRGRSKRPSFPGAAGERGQLSRGLGPVMAAAPVSGWPTRSWRLCECWAGCIAVSLVVLRVVPGWVSLIRRGGRRGWSHHHERRERFTAQSGLQDTHRTPTGTAPIPAGRRGTTDTARMEPLRLRRTAAEGLRLTPEMLNHTKRFQPSRLGRG